MFCLLVLYRLFGSLKRRPAILSLYMSHTHEVTKQSHQLALDLFPSLSSWSWGQPLTPVFPVGRDFMLLLWEHTQTISASGVSLASWPTTSSSLLQTKIDSIIHPSKSSKNVNKEQKSPVLYTSEGLSWNWALPKLILLQAWPWPLCSTPFSKASVQGSAP